MFNKILVIIDMKEKENIINVNRIFKYVYADLELGVFTFIFASKKMFSMGYEIFVFFIMFI